MKDTNAEYLTAGAVYNYRYSCNCNIEFYNTGTSSHIQIGVLGPKGS
jgi:hypothetical protein